MAVTAEAPYSGAAEKASESTALQAAGFAAILLLTGGIVYVAVTAVNRADSVIEQGQDTFDKATAPLDYWQRLWS